MLYLEFFNHVHNAITLKMQVNRLRTEAKKCDKDIRDLEKKVTFVFFPFFLSLFLGTLQRQWRRSSSLVWCTYYCNCSFLANCAKKKHEKKSWIDECQDGGCCWWHQDEIENRRCNNCFFDWFVGCEGCCHCYKMFE